MAGVKRPFNTSHLDGLPPPPTHAAAGSATSATVSVGSTAPAPGLRPAGSPEGTGAPGAAGTPGAARGMRPSVPVRLQIPAIGVDTEVMALGLRSDGTLEVPPLRGDAPAGWYRHSPTPGEPGASVLAGHVDTARDGPAVFFRLRELEAGDPIAVRRQDGTVARFRVSRVATYSKQDFPSHEMYAPLASPGLRLITCGGAFDRGEASYRSNVVAYADPVT